MTSENLNLFDSKLNAPWTTVQPIQFINNTLRLLDQRILPHKVEYLEFTEFYDVANAITQMVVRGAPAIGITAAYGIVLAAQEQMKHGHSQLDLDTAFHTLAASRPTAVNLFWSLEKMKNVLVKVKTQDIQSQFHALKQTADNIFNDDIKANKLIGEIGSALIEQNSQVYTHCNAGALATGGYGTALGVIRSAFSQNKISHVYAGETRPWLQGSRLTAWELMQDNIPVTVSTEGAAGQLLKKGDIKWVIVGADRIAANGDVANKIGTYNLAVLAKFHNVKFMVVAPTSTFDLATSSGNDIPIEDRPQNEVTTIGEQPIAPLNCQAINPSFDITPHTLIDAIVCEKGILKPPFSQAIVQSLGVTHA